MRNKDIKDAYSTGREQARGDDRGYQRGPFSVGAGRCSLPARILLPGLFQNIAGQLNTVKKLTVALGVLFAMAALFPGLCRAGDEIRIASTILPLAEFAEKVGGERVRVSVIIPPGANPHTYDPTPGQMRAISDADLYIKVGTNIEFEKVWLGKLRSLNKNMEICDASNGIKLIGMGGGHHSGEHAGHEHGGKDPHTWLSPLNAIIMTANIRDSLVKMDPSNREYYEENSREYIVALSHLNRYIKNNLRGMRGEAFMVFHPAWGYYAADYGLKELAVEHQAKDPTPGQMAKLIKKAKALGIKVVFASPQFNRRSADVIARGINGRVEFIDPLAKGYIENLKQVTDALAGDR